MRASILFESGINHGRDPEITMPIDGPATHLKGHQQGITRLSCAEVMYRVGSCRALNSR